MPKEPKLSKILLLLENVPDEKAGFAIQSLQSLSARCRVAGDITLAEIRELNGALATASRLIANYYDNRGGFQAEACGLPVSSKVALAIS